MFDQSFSRKLRKIFERSGWSVEKNPLVECIISRGPFRIAVLSGPRYVDARFPFIEAFLSKDVVLAKQQFKLLILIVVSDRATLPTYRKVRYEGVEVLHWEDLGRLEGLDVPKLSLVMPDDPSMAWAVGFAAGNAKLCRQLAHYVGGQGNPAQALRWAEAAIASDSRSPDAFYELSGRHLALNDFEKAEAGIAAAIRLLDGDSSAIYSNRASVISLRLGNLPEAVVHAEQAVQAVNCRAADHHHLALVYLRTGAYAKAQQAAKQAALLDPDNERFKIMLKDCATRIQDRNGTAT